MRKSLLILGGCLLFFSALAMEAKGDDVTSFQCGYWFGMPASNDVQTVSGFRLGLPFCGGRNYVNGVEFALLAASTAKNDGWQFAPIAVLSDEFGGWQLAALFTYSEDCDGLQTSILNMAKDMGGVQIGAVNSTQHAKGIQLSVVNLSVSVNGLQLGLINVSREASVQLGLLNFNNASSLFFLPFVNCSTW